MAFWRVIGRLAFDTAAHRNTAGTAIVEEGGTGQAYTDPQGRPAIRFDVAATDEAQARRIRNRVRTARENGWIVAGKFHLHRCTHDEPPDNWRNCKTLQYEES